jgi:putative membrane protein
MNTKIAFILSTACAFGSLQALAEAPTLNSTDPNHYARPDNTQPGANSTQNNNSTAVNDHTSVGTGAQGSNSNSLTSGTTSSNSAADNNTMVSTDKKSSPAANSNELSLLKELHQTNLAEIKLGQLAQQKAAASRVKDLGRRIEMDHQFADQKIQALARSRGSDLSSGAIEKEQSDKIQSLEGLDGKNFDRAFVQMMVSDHQSDISRLTAIPDDQNDVDVNRFVKKVVPILGQHREVSQKLASNLE